MSVKHGTRWVPRELPAGVPLYLALADRISEDVQSGRLIPGARLPAQRDLAEQLGVDLTTVTRGYAEARRRGLLSGQVGRGTFVSPALAALDAGVGRGTPGVTDLSLNLPPRLESDIASEALSNTLARSARSVHSMALLAYQDNAGMQSHREAGAAWIGRRLPDADAERVVLTCGAQHGILVLLSRLAARGDVVLTERHTFPGFVGAAEYLGVRVRGVDTDDDGIDVDAFRKACRAGARVLYTTPTIQNPTTVTMPASRRAALAKVARQYGVRIIEDDVYGMLALDAPPALSSYAPELSYYVVSLTKAIAGGLRIGYVLSPTASDAERVAAGVRVTTWSAPPLMAHVASDWVRSRVAADLLKANRAEATRRQALAAREFHGWSWHANPSGYHGWLELPDEWTSAEFVAQARRRGVLVTPADAFAADADSATAAVRVCVTAPPGRPELEDALGRVRQLLEVGPWTSARTM
jgi:DNA-binding transcriptional MocR family regulator